MSEILYNFFASGHLKPPSTLVCQCHLVRVEPLKSLLRNCVPVVKVPKVVEETVHLVTLLLWRQLLLKVQLVQLVVLLHAVALLRPELLHLVTPGATILQQHLLLLLVAGGEEEEGVRFKECEWRYWRRRRKTSAFRTSEYEDTVMVTVTVTST